MAQLRSNLYTTGETSIDITIQLLVVIQNKNSDIVTPKCCAINFKVVL